MGPDSNFSTLRAVITGASSGIGQAIALSLAKRIAGAQQASDRDAADAGRIVVHFRGNAAGAEETAAAIRALGVDSCTVQADICRQDEREALVERAAEYLGSISTWVNNAGADVLTGDAAAWSFEAKLRSLMDTDVIGTIALTRSVVERMEENHWSLPPTITFVGWDQATEGMDGDAGQLFGTTKAAVMAFANSLAQELAPRIRVNTLAPGWIKTAWGNETSDYWSRRACSESLMDRWGTPEDVAAAACFVVDPNNSFCCGQTIRVNGGWNRNQSRDGKR